LENNICEVLVIAEEPSRDLLKDAEDQQESTIRYNEELDLKDRVAIDIMQ